MTQRTPFVIAVDFSKYSGKYVAIVGKRVVSSGIDAQKVWLDAKRKYPNAQRELLKVPKGEAKAMDLVFSEKLAKTGAREFEAFRRELSKRFES